MHEKRARQTPQLEEVGIFMTTNVKEINDTYRGISEYAELLGFKTDQDFIHYINGHLVLDSGSGQGILAKMCTARQINTRIISLNPGLANFSKRIREKASTRHLESKSPLREFIQQTHDRFAVAGIAQELPFPNDTFDTILDNFSAFCYSPLPSDTSNNSIVIFETLVSEYLRVLKPGGKIRAMVTYSDKNTFKHTLDYSIREKERLTFIQSELTKLRINFTKIYDRQERHKLIGFEITK